MEDVLQNLQNEVQTESLHLKIQHFIPTNVQVTQISLKKDKFIDITPTPNFSRKPYNMDEFFSVE